MKKYKSQLQVGSLDSKKQAALPTPPPSPPAQKEIVKPSAESGSVAPMPAKDAQQVEEDDEPPEQFGDLVPYADPSWYQSVSIMDLSNEKNYSIVVANFIYSTTRPTTMRPM